MTESLAVSPVRTLVDTEMQHGSLSLLREPEEVLADAQKVAAALMRVVNSKKKQIAFNGETYLESGDWQTVAAFHGVTAKVESTKYVQYGDVVGFEAAAVAIDRNGREVSRGEAMCLNDEENWGNRAKYEWQDVLDANGKKIWEYNEAKGKNLPKRSKVQVGETQTPLFQLRSMAQTRACGKALSNLFKWVVVLAGYKPTPAEEMIGRGDEEPDLPSEKQQNLSADPTPASTSARTVGADKPVSTQSSGAGSTTREGAISHGEKPPTASAQPQTIQGSTQKPAAQQGASQPQPGYTKRIGTDGLIATIKGLENVPGKPKTATNKAVNPWLKVILLSPYQGASWASCFDDKFWPCLRESIGQQCEFQIVEKENKGNTFLNILDVRMIAGEEYVDGKPILPEGAGQ